MASHGLVGVADAGAFLFRLTRLDPGALVRLRQTSSSRTALWARLPWDALVTREVSATGGPEDATVGANELLAALTRKDDRLPGLKDAQWRWPLPPAARAETVESVSAAELSGLAAAAAETLREVSAGALGDRAIGQRAVRDALLDHVALRVTRESGGEPVEVSQRLVQAISRMGFLGPDPGTSAETRVRVAGRWVGLSAPYGVGWLQTVGKLTVMPISSHPIG